MTTVISGIVLKNFNYGDHHKIVKLFSAENGLISIYVPYANKKKSRYAALCDPLSLVNLTVRPPRDENSDLYFLVHGYTCNAFYEWKIDYDKLMHFYEMAELVLGAGIEIDYLPYVYNLLLSILNSNDALDIKTAVFKLKLLTILGLQPEINGCASCGLRTDIVTLSIKEGGLLCVSCYREEVLPLQAHLIPFIRQSFHQSIDEMSEGELTESDIQQIHDWLNLYYEAYSGLRLKVNKMR